MRKIVITFTLLFSLMTAVCASKPVTVDLQKKWGPVMKAIEQVESDGRANAVSKNGKWVGCLQISEILVRQCNQILGKKKFTYKDRYSKEKSYEMFIVYQEYFNKEGNMEKAIRLWNSGDLNCMKRKSGTTTEPALAFRVFRDLLEKKYGEEGAKERINFFAPSSCFHPSSFRFSFFVLRSSSFVSA